MQEFLTRKVTSVLITSLHGKGRKSGLQSSKVSPEQLGCTGLSTLSLPHLICWCQQQGTQTDLPICGKICLVSGCEQNLCGEGFCLLLLSGTWNQWLLPAFWLLVPADQKDAQDRWFVLLHDSSFSWIIPIHGGSKEGEGIRVYLCHEVIRVFWERDIIFPPCSNEYVYIFL